MFEPENELEESLVKAFADPAYRPQFYKDLAHSNIFIVQHDKVPKQEGEITLESGTPLEIRSVEIEGELCIPIFSSVRRIEDAVQGEVGYLALNALEFFKIVSGSDLILNLGSEYGKKFTKDEIASIIDGTIWETGETYRVEEETQVLIGQPEKYPQALVDALIKYFKTKNEVVSAYLALFYNPKTDEKPHTLIGILVTENWDEIVSSVGMIANQVEVPDPPIDIIKIDTKSGNIDYFHEIKPFYKKKKFGLF